MRRRSAFRRFLMAVGFVVLLAGSFLTLNVTTSSCAQAQIPCTAIVGGISDMLTWIETNVTEFSLDNLVDRVSVFFETMAERFVDTITNMMKRVAGRIQDTIETGWAFNLLPALQARTDQLNTLNADQGRALGSFQDARNQNRVMKEIEDMRLQSLREQRTSGSVCVAGSIAGGMPRAASLERAYRAAAPAERVARSGNSKNIPDTDSMGADSKARYQNYIARYCNELENGGAPGCGSSGAYAGQDLDVAGTIFGRATIDMTSAATRKTVDDLIENIMEPFIRDPVAAGSVNSADGQREILEGRSISAKRQTGFDGMHFVVGNRLPGSGMQQSVEALRKASGIPTSLIGSNPSNNEIIEAMMVDRYQSGKYAIGRVEEPANNEREAVIQAAFAMMNMSRIIDGMHRSNLMQAADIGSHVREDKKSTNAQEELPLKP